MEGVSSLLPFLLPGVLETPEVRRRGRGERLRIQAARYLLQLLFGERFVRRCLLRCTFGI
jgi:hypothetical protein